LGTRRAGDAFALRRAAGLVASELRRAHAAAVAENADHTVEFVLGSPGALAVYRAKLATENCPSGMAPVSSTLCRRLIAAGEWPGSVGIESANTTFPSCAAPADPANKCVVFKPLGYAETSSSCSSSPCQVQLRSRSGVGAAIAVALPTGRVSVLP
ncbi:MAG TPA: hypothetical protein VNN19_03725, partial [bacterium]|nr:hypothetical protein [bacterium]